MARRFAIWTDFKVGKNETGSAIAMSKMGLQSLQKTAKTTASVMKGVIGGMVVYGGLSRLQEGIGAATQQFVDFDHTVTSAGARFGREFYRGTLGAEQLRDAVRDVGASTEFTASQVAVGLGEYAKAGIDASTSMGMLQDTARLATNAEVDFAQAASISLDALDSFNLRSKDAAQTASNLSSVNDILTRVVTSAKLEFTDFAETLSYAGPVAAQTGASLKSMAVLTGLVAKAGIRGSMAGTTLKNTYLALAAPVGKGKTALKKLGIQITDNAGNMRDTLDILIDFKKATESMGNAQRLATIDAVYGKRAIAGVSKILSMGVSDLEEYRDGLKETGGAASEMANEMRNSIQNRIEKLRSAAVELGFKFFDAFGPHVEAGIKSVSDWLDEANRPGSEMVSTLKDVAEGLSSTIKFIIENRGAIMSLAKAYLYFKTAMFTSGLLTSMATGIYNINTMSAGFKTLDGNITMTTNGTSRLTRTLGKLSTMIGPLTLALQGGLAIGNEIWNSIEKSMRASDELNNKLVEGATGRKGGKSISMEDASADLKSLQEGFKKRFGSKVGSEYAVSYGKNVKWNETAQGKAYLALMSGDYQKAIKSGQFSGTDILAIEAMRGLSGRLKKGRTQAQQNVANQEVSQSNPNLPWYNTRDWQYTTENVPTKFEKTQKSEKVIRQEVIHTHKFELPDGVKMTETKTEKKSSSGMNPAGVMP